ncbi:MAG: PhnD/SsuA/transferrin family substrate-binding protein [Gaiellales bacterium]
MTALRVHSFLSDVARPHFSAVSQLVARAAGLDPARLDEPALEQLDEVLATPGPALLFLCGLPYVRAYDRGIAVEALAAAVPLGEPAPQYYADLVVRDGLEPNSADELVGRRIGLNGRDSLSGYVLPYAALDARGIAAPLYEDAIVTGSHRRSLAMIVAGELDAASIDSTHLALRAAHEPAIAELRVVERLGPAPIPPVVLLHGTPALARSLRAALLALGASAEGRAALELGQVERYVAVADRDYDPVRAMDGAVR